MEPKITRYDAPVSEDASLVGHLSASVVTPASLDHIRIGKYQLKQEIGGGGMGVVYQAIQEQPRRLVALKLMRSGMPSRSAQRRFEYESQLLARLRHPAIAQVYDAGTHQQGDNHIPYFVMEYIPDARSITEYARAHKLSQAQRLELFAHVCDAVHHAHQKGIIHRDIKPQNILVDSQGQPKVIDFGVARAVDADMAPITLQTEAHQLIGTLQYMSPEQLQVEPSELDARSDVYSLGVVLYELLCTRLPYEVSRANLSEATRMIREDMPYPPRLACANLDPDVETILLKAMHKERVRRYQSAAALAEDIRRALAAQPIEARRDSATYVLRKRARALVTAHRVSMWIVVVVLSILLAEGAGRLIVRTPMHLLFNRLITSHMQPVAALPPMQFVQILEIDERTDFAQLAQEAGIKGFSPSDEKAPRLLHAHMLHRLVDARPRVVVFDIYFAQVRDAEGNPLPCPHEKELLEGILALKGEGIPVVLAAGSEWAVDEEYLPRGVCRTLTREARFGFATGATFGNSPWSLHLIMFRKGRTPQLSLALAACAAYWHPDRFAWARQDSDSGSRVVHASIHYAIPSAVRAREWGAPAEPFFNRVRLSDVYQMEEDDLDMGRGVGDVVGHYILHVPSDDVLRRATTSFADAVRASPQQLREWFQDKVVVIGDARPGRDGPHQHPSGRQYSGFVAHAVGIDSVLAARMIVVPPHVQFAGMSLDSTRVYAAAAAILAGVLALWAAPALWRRFTLSALMLALLLGFSVLLYWRWGVLLDPMMPILGSLLVIQGVWIVRRARANPLIDL